MTHPAPPASVARWFERPMRIAALQGNFSSSDKQTLAVADQWREFGANVEQLNHLCADGLYALFDERRHGRMLRRYLAKAHRQGLRIILYLNIHLIDPRDNARRKVLAQQDSDGVHVKFYTSYYACCLNSKWREYYFRALDNLAQYDIDGIFLDGPVNIAGGCHCPFCQAKHKTWFGRPLGRVPASTAFLQRTQREFLEENYRRFKAIKPDGIVYQNLPVARPAVSGLDLRRALAVNDIVGTEGGFMFYGPPKNSFLWRPGYEARLLEAVAPNKPRVIFMASNQQPWAWYQHTAAETSLCMASIAANGATIWYGLHGTMPLLKTPGGQAAGRMFRFLKQHESCFADTGSIAKIALLYSYETEKALNFPAGASDFYGSGGKAREGTGNPWEASRGFADILTRSHVPYDLVSDLDISPATLARYDCVILPSVGCMSPAVADALREYVRHGGNLIATFNSSLYDEKGRPRRDFALADVFGVRALSRVTYYRNFNYQVPTQNHALFAGLSAPYWPAPGAAMDVRARQGRVLAQFLKPWVGRYVPRTALGFPSMTFNKYGKGRCLYMAGTVGEFCFEYSPPEYRQIIGNILAAWVRSPVVLEGARSPVEVTVRAQGKRWIVHLVNHSSFDARPLERIEPLRNLTLTVRRPPASCTAKALALGQVLAARKTACGCCLHLPELREYEVIVINRSCSR